MTIESAISKAIGGGWNPKVYPDKDSDPLLKVAGVFTPSLMPDMVRVVLSEWGAHRILLDPAFWRALGKAEGWKDKEIKEKYPLYLYQTNGDNTLLEENFAMPDWLIAMHRMIDALAEGKSIEDFFAQL